MAAAFPDAELVEWLRSQRRHQAGRQIGLFVHSLCTYGAQSQRISCNKINKIADNCQPTMSL
jgi:hypothetical protein